MTFTIVSADQRSPEWFSARLGRVTGSRAADVTATIKSAGEAAARRDYRLQLVCERLTGQSQDDVFINKEMQRGIDLEPAARAAYEAATGTLVRTTGFLSHTEHMAGCSLDGDVGNFAGILELKCPKSSTHLKYLRGKTLPPEYLAQVTHNAWVSGAKFVDFGSFDDRFPLHLQLFRVRVYREQLAIASYESEALRFLEEVAALERELREFKQD